MIAIITNKITIIIINTTIIIITTINDSSGSVVGGHKSSGSGDSIAWAKGMEGILVLGAYDKTWGSYRFIIIASWKQNSKHMNRNILIFITSMVYDDYYYSNTTTMTTLTTLTTLTKIVTNWLMFMYACAHLSSLLLLMLSSSSSSSSSAAAAAAVAVAAAVPT